jgi:hypothetical protein
MQNFGEISVSQVDVMLLQNRHFRHPWRSFVLFADKIVGTILHERSEPEG